MPGLENDAAFASDVCNGVELFSVAAVITYNLKIE